MPSVFLEKNYAAEFLISEGDRGYSRDEVIVDGGVKLEAGTILAKNTASGFYVPFNPIADDGSQIPNAILIAPVNAEEGPVPGTVIARFAQVKASMLVFANPLTNDQREGVIGALRDLGIIARQ